MGLLLVALTVYWFTLPLVVPTFSPSKGTTRAPAPPTQHTCVTRYSSFRCVGNGFEGTAGVYGFPIHNRSCVFENVTYDHDVGRFVFHVNPADSPTSWPATTLAPRGFDLPIMKWKRIKVIKKMLPFHEYRLVRRVGPIPCDFEFQDSTLAYYSPIVAPWNYAHTLLCDLFGLFWAMVELNVVALDTVVVAVGAHYASSFPLPNRNAAFELFSRVKPMYDRALPSRTCFRRLVVGSGTKSWSWVTDDYRASGSRELWWAFRQHIIDVTGARERTRSVDWTKRLPRDSTLKVSICHKKDKRGVVNYEEIAAELSHEFPQMKIVLESAVGRSPVDQVQMMLDADIYICNEGTLATSFFLMPPGSAFISLPLVYHGPHLHQRGFSPPTDWWKEPDPLRPDPRKNTGGNIDWFPPSIPWVRVSWYDYVPLNETKIQLPLGSLRNYMPDFNIVLQRHRLLPLLNAAREYVASPSRSITANPNYSKNAELCRQILEKDPTWTKAFNSVKCYYGMSWLCEFWTNTHHEWRFFHEKWRLSKGRCGNNMTSPQAWGIEDPRSSRSLADFLFYTRSRLEKLYTTTDFGGNFSARPEDLVFF